MFLAIILIGTALNAQGSPVCLAKDGQTLPIDDANALNLEATTPNQYTTEAHVEGVISDIYPDHSGHNHFAIQFPGTSGGIEVVYNQSFGALPELSPGMTVEACGEFITSTEATSQYPASPMNAIIHWVHINTSRGKGAHPSGYLVIDGELYGQDTSHAGSKPEPIL